MVSAAQHHAQETQGLEGYRLNREMAEKYALIERALQQIYNDSPKGDDGMVRYADYMRHPMSRDWPIKSEGRLLGRCLRLDEPERSLARLAYLDHGGVINPGLERLPPLETPPHTDLAMAVVLAAATPAGTEEHQRLLINRFLMEYSGELSSLYIQGPGLISSPHPRLVNHPLKQDLPTEALHRHALEQLAWVSYLRHKGRCVSVTSVMAVDEFGGERELSFPNDPLVVRVDDCLRRAEVARWTDDNHLDPVWRVTPATPADERIAHLCNFRVYAANYCMDGKTMSISDIVDDPCKVVQLPGAHRIGNHEYQVDLPFHGHTGFPVYIDGNFAGTFGRLSDALRKGRLKINDLEEPQEAPPDTPKASPDTPRPRIIRNPSP